MQQPKRRGKAWLLESILSMCIVLPSAGDETWALGHDEQTFCNRAASPALKRVSAWKPGHGYDYHPSSIPPVCCIYLTQRESRGHGSNWCCTHSWVPPGSRMWSMSVGTEWIALGLVNRHSEQLRVPGLSYTSSPSSQRWSDLILHASLCIYSSKGKALSFSWRLCLESDSQLGPIRSG